MDPVGWQAVLAGDVGSDGGEHFVASVCGCGEVDGVLVGVEHERSHDAVVDVDAQVDLLCGDSFVEGVEGGLDAGIWGCCHGGQRRAGL